MTEARTLYIINGTMGVGKTAVCTCLKKRLESAVFLDGDWCWDMDPFTVNDETKAMVLDNIIHVLNNFISCSCFKNIIFCWVIHEQSIMEAILSSLRLDDIRLRLITLTAKSSTLIEHLKRDIRDGKREESIIGRSLERLPLYACFDTVKISVDGKTPHEIAQEICVRR